MKYNSIAFIFMSIIAFAGCTKVPDESELIRPRINLTFYDIPALEKMGDSNTGHFSVSKSYKSALYSYQWTSIDSNHCFVRIQVFENSTEAYDYFIYGKNGFASERNSYDKTIDTPSVAGNCSYNSGQEFVRNNLYVIIITDESTSDLIPDISKSIDEKILESETFLTIDHLKIRFANLYFEENPAPKNKKIPLKIHFQPANQEVYIDFTVISFEELVVEGVTIDNQLNIFYDSTIVHPDKTKIGIVVSTVSNYGFCSDSTIYIQFQ